LFGRKVPAACANVGADAWRTSVGAQRSEDGTGTHPVSVPMEILTAFREANLRAVSAGYHDNGRRWEDSCSEARLARYFSSHTSSWA
jgi:hypothetical protein